MAHIRILPLALVAVAWLILMPAPAPADAIIDVTLNTSGLSSSYNPYTVEFDLTQGDPANINTVTLSNFNLGGGIPSTTSTFGGASGNMATSVVLTDDPSATPPGGFFNSFMQQFTIGSQISFQIDTTTNYVQNTPDNFSFYLSDANGAFTASDPSMDPSNALFTFDIGSGTLLDVNSYDTVSPAASGSVTLSAASFVVTYTNVVPEPASLLLLGTGLATVAGYIRRQRRRQR